MILFFIKCGSNVLKHYLIVEPSSYSGWGKIDDMVKPGCMVNRILIIIIKILNLQTTNNNI